MFRWIWLNWLGWLASVGLAHGQALDAHADSLEKALRMATDYNAQVELLGELSDYFSYRDSAAAMGYALQIGDLARQHNDPRGQGIGHFRVGGVFYELFQVDSAMAAYEKASRLLEKDTSFLGQQYLARTWYNYGAQYQRKGDEEAFLDLILNKSIPIYERIGDSLGMGKSLHNIGLIFQNSKELDRAVYYLQKAIAALTPYPRTPELVDSYSKLAEALIYLSETQTVKAAEVERQLNRADSLLSKHPDNYSYILYLNALGMYEERFNKRLDKALEVYLRGTALADEYGMYMLSTTLLNRAYYIYDKQGKNQLALNTVKRILGDYDGYLMPNGRSVQLRNLANSHEKLGNIREAYRVQKQYIRLSDSIHNAEMAFKIHSLEQRFEAKEKEAQIIRLNQQMQAQEMQAERNRLLTALLAGAVVLVAGISFAGYNIFRKKQLIAKQQAELLKQHMEKMEQEQHISVFSAMLEGQEQERKRLAIDLHDGLGGSLSSIKMKLSKAVQLANGAAGNDLPAILHQLDASVDDLRRIARNLMPETLLKYGLAVALRDFCKSLEQEETSISFQSYGLKDDIPRAVQIMVYRIIQELISNALRHAKATHILAQCLQSGNQLSITVEDDGVGIDEAKHGRPGMGLANVRSRVAYLGGRLDIHSEAGVGTTVNIELTYATAKQPH